MWKKTTVPGTQIEDMSQQIMLFFSVIKWQESYSYHFVLKKWDPSDQSFSNGSRHDDDIRDWNPGKRFGRDFPFTNKFK